MVGGRWGTHEEYAVTLEYYCFCKTNVKCGNINIFVCRDYVLGVVYRTQECSQINVLIEKCGYSPVSNLWWRFNRFFSWIHTSLLVSTST